MEDTSRKKGKDDGNINDGNMSIDKMETYLSEERYEESDDKQSFGKGRRTNNASNNVSNKMAAISTNVPEQFKASYRKGADGRKSKRTKKSPPKKHTGKKRFIKNAGRTVMHKTTEAVSDMAQADDTEHDGRGAADDTEHTGQGSNKNVADNAENVIKSGLKGVALQVLLMLKLLFKLMVAVMGKIVIVAVIAVIVTITVILPAIEDATYDFIADEKVQIRQIMSQVTSELSAEIRLKQTINGCDTVVTTGNLTDWKNVIAFWWTITRNMSSGENYKGSDYEDIKYVFYEFNHIGYLTDSEDKVLNVVITNSSFEDVSSHWMLSDGDKTYYETMIADDEVWEEVLGTTELSRIAFAEVGNGMDKYREWYGSESGDISGEFTLWCMNEAGLISDNFISKTDSSQALMQELNRKKFLHYASEKGEEEGDIIFLQINGQIVSGIITRINKDTMYVTMNGFTSHVTVEEQTFDKASGLVKAYAHIDGFFVEALLNTGNVAAVSGNGELLWPVGGEFYQVTSPYGRRESPGGIGSTNHMGIDIAASYGTPIVACAEGTVIAASYTGSMGNYVKINHHNGLTTIYMHNSSLNVVVGQEVAAGEVIAYAGSTGNSTGTHCHLGVIKEDVGYVDPAPYVGIPEGFKGNAEIYIKGAD